MRQIKYIIVHCSATKEGEDYRAKDIDRWHRQKGYAGIGYHFVVDLDGTIERGRDIKAAGAHCLGHNMESVGVCYIGGIGANGRAADTRTEAQKESLTELIKALKTQFRGAEVRSHRDFANKACPCFDATGEYKLI